MNNTVNSISSRLRHVTARTWCTDGAQLLNGACYFFSSSSTKTTWFIARMDCLARGGDLVKITSSAVWDILKSAVASSGVGYWVGLAGNYWYWSNGEWKIDCVTCGIFVRILWHFCKLTIRYRQVIYSTSVYLRVVHGESPDMTSAFAQCWLHWDTIFRDRQFHSGWSAL